MEKVWYFLDIFLATSEKKILKAVGRDWEEIVTSARLQVDNNIDKKCMEEDVILLMLNAHRHMLVHVKVGAQDREQAEEMG